MMDQSKEVREILRAVLQIEGRADDLEESTPLLGNIPELDSMAVAMLVSAIEEYFDLTIDDDEISSETFETFGSLCRFIEQKTA